MISISIYMTLSSVYNYTAQVTEKTGLSLDPNPVVSPTFPKEAFPQGAELSSPGNAGAGLCLPG